MARVKKEMSDTPLENKTSKKTNLTAAEKKEYLQKIEQQNFAQNKSKETFKQVRYVTKTVSQTTLSSYNK